MERPGGASVAYATFLRFLGMSTRATFLFDPADGGLTGGMYMAEPAELSCVAQFRTLRLMTASGRSGDAVETVRGTGSGAPTPTAACRRFREAAQARPWSTVYRRGDDGRVSARLRLFREGETPRILACFGEVRACRWPPGLDVEEGPVLAPAARDTGSAQPE